jgi:hypothetical protein
MHFMLYSGVGFCMEPIFRFCVDCHYFLGINRRYSKVQLYRVPGKHHSTQNNPFMVSIVAPRECFT